MAEPNHDPANLRAIRAAEKFARREATIGVVGLGYVGLPMARALLDAGFRVVGYDIDDEKIRKIQSGESYLTHLGEDLARLLATSQQFQATTNPGDLRAADGVVVCVPTPLGQHQEPDLSFLERSTQMVAEVLHPGMLVAVESTSFPGTTREVCLPILEASGLICGRDFYLVFSPEREDPGRAGVSTKHITRLVGGVDAMSTIVGLALYRATVDQVVEVESAEVAEAAKLLENVYRAVNIALVNELKPVFTRLNIDIWQVIRAASTKPFGFQPFFPGPGLGGHCIPIDPFYLTWKAREVGLPTRFIELAGEINSRMPRYVVDRTIVALNEIGKPLRESDILVIGLAYKPDINDIRETPAAEIMQLLDDLGARVSYHDPHVPAFPGMRRHKFDLKSEPLTAERLTNADCVLIVTDHRAVDWALVGRCARLIVDTRNVMAGVRQVQARVVKA